MCILKKANYPELTVQAGTAARGTTDRILELLASLRAGLNPDHQTTLLEIEELTVLEAAQSQDGLARLLCGCSECLGYQAA